MCNTTEEKVLRKEIGVGNEVLYQLCQDHHILKTNNERYTDGLAAQMWLIGRSYAASPERRGYGVLKGTKVEYSVSGNGLDDYFDKLANGFVGKFNDESNSNLKKLFGYLNNNYTFKDEDIATLKNSITAVLKLNRVLKQVRFEIDKEDLIKHIENYKEYQVKYPIDTVQRALADFEKNNRNMISFCSKFLHFHFPDTVFIIDSITKSHFKVKGEKYLFKFNNSESVIEVLKSHEKTLKNNFLSEFENEGLTDPEKEYVTHCIREYLLAKAINENCNDIFKDKHIPRVVDTYLLVANSK